MDYEFDCLVIGGGSAGYAAARTLVAAGWRVGVVEAGPELGGLCILRGCMPTKALLHAATLRQSFREAAAWGISAPAVHVDPTALWDRKDFFIDDFARHRRGQLESGRFTLLRGKAHFLDAHTLRVGHQHVHTARHFLIATGSEVAPPPLPGLAEAGFLTSDDAVRLRRLPESLVVLGGGAVALEFAQFFARLGTLVTVIQRSPQLLRDFDADLADEVEAALAREGIQVYTDTRLLEVRRVAGGREITFEEAGRVVKVAAGEILLALGRRPHLAGLHPERAGVELSPSGHIRTDLHQRTTAPHVFAAGDVCGPYEIVHLAVQQGEVAARTLLDPATAAPMDYRLLVNVVFTDPAAASVGASERQLKAAGVDYRAATYPFNDHGKSMIRGAQEGLVKLIADPATGEILGGACVGPEGGELIHEIVVAMAGRMTVGALARVPHYHPTLSEIWTYPAEELAEKIRG